MYVSLEFVKVMFLYCLIVETPVHTKFIVVTLTTILIATIMVTITVNLLRDSSVFAYNKFGFESEEQCVKITNLEHQSGVLDNTTYTKLINICNHVVTNSSDTDNSGNKTN